MGGLAGHTWRLENEIALRVFVGFERGFFCWKEQAEDDAVRDGKAEIRRFWGCREAATLRKASFGWYIFLFFCLAFRDQKNKNKRLFLSFVTKKSRFPYAPCMPTRCSLLLRWVQARTP